MARRPRDPEARRMLAAQLAHQRDIAQRINAREPRWDVMFGAGSWKFWAFAAWPTPHAILLSDPDPAGLLHQMRQAETEYVSSTVVAARLSRTL
jgi:hypothetical protein